MHDEQKRERVIGMDAQAGTTGDAAYGELLRPDHWLVFGLEWTGDGGMAEAAFAVAPPVIPRSMLSRSTQQVLNCSDLYARRRGCRVVFFADLTRLFGRRGTSWDQLGVSWEAVLAELQAGPFPAMYLTVSQRAHIHICNAAISLTIYGPDGAEEATDAERDLVRQALARQLAADWPPYVKELIEAGKTRPVS